MQVQRHAAGIQRLQVGAARVGSATQHDGATLAALQVRQHRIETHVGIDRHGAGVVTLEGFTGVLLGGGADVAALGIEDQRHLRVRRSDVAAQVFELVFGTRCGEVGDLWLEGAGQVGGGVNNVLAKFQNCVWAALQRRWHALHVRVEADAQ